MTKKLKCRDGQTTAPHSQISPYRSVDQNYLIIPDANSWSARRVPIRLGLNCYSWVSTVQSWCCSSVLGAGRNRTLAAASVVGAR